MLDNFDNEESSFYEDDYDDYLDYLEDTPVISEYDNLDNFDITSIERLEWERENMGKPLIRNFE